MQHDYNYQLVQYFTVISMKKDISILDYKLKQARLEEQAMDHYLSFFLKLFHPMQTTCWNMPRHLTAGSELIYPVCFDHQ
uniref:Uncharacterized protein n=1 Tax=Arundo donax TaxID=35708 RepID=A0A0A8YXJ8_ARUDO